MKINYIYTLEKMDDSIPSIFLAGCSLRPSQFHLDIQRWRLEFIKFLEFKGVKDIPEINLIIPEYRNEIPPDNWTYSRQVSWEVSNLKKSTVICFWIYRSEHLKGLTTNIELGEYLNSGKIIVGYPENSLNNNYITERLDLLSLPIHKTLKSLVDNSIEFLKQKLLMQLSSKTYFTSDTHFNEERTMSLFKRPFNTVIEMNFEIIKQWNMKITPNDVVYHLGDFGDYKFIQYLDFKKLYLIVGNYDKNLNKIKEMFPEKDIYIVQDSVHKIVQDNHELNLTHYPSLTTEQNKFYLYGHIHGLRMVKRNGLNVGVDAHHYKPLSFEDVLYYKNAIMNHYDNEVFE